MMSKVANKSDKGRAAGPDSTQIMLQKNDRIKDKHMKELRRLGCEAQRSSTDLEKQILGLQKEIRDIHAYTVVYKDNSLLRIDERRSKPSYSNFLASGNPPPQQEVASKPKAKISCSVGSHDPFRLRSCLIDVDIHSKEMKQQPKSAHNEPRQGPGLSVRKRLKRSSTAVNTKTGGSKEYQSLLPGNCTSYYSIRKYYEQEKDKLLQKHSPEEKRKRTVQWILDNVRLPQFSVIRRTTTSAIFREFHQYRSSADDVAHAQPSQVSPLPGIADEEVSKPAAEIIIVRSLSDVG